MNKVKIIYVFIYVISCFFLYSQQTAVPEILVPMDSLRPNADNLQLAISSRDYPVTPGDVYTLSFIMAGNPVSNNLLVESDYSINLDVLGKIDAKNMTYPELKPIVELIIADAYPRSMPSLTIQTIGSFQVSIVGAIEATQYRRAWGLMRLSDVVQESFSDFSSIRNIEIISIDGETNEYDLLRARMLGEVDQDPYLKPGDTISVSRVNKLVEVEGQVLRPGAYQLVEGESSANLLDFCGGLTLSSNPDRIRIVRSNGDEPSSSSFVDISEFREGIELRNGDIVTVFENRINQPFVYIEGGIIAEETPDLAAIDNLRVAAADEDNGEEAPEYNSRIMHPIGIGDTLYDVLLEFRESINTYADLSAGYIIRRSQDEPIFIDMFELLYSKNMEHNIELVPNDIIAIPILLPQVSVIGAVNMPGQYGYNPVESAVYYINQAGGFNDQQNSGNKYEVLDKFGVVKKNSNVILPGDTIRALNNDFWYSFGERFGPITTAALFIASAISLINVINMNQ